MLQLNLNTVVSLSSHFVGLSVYSPHALNILFQVHVTSGKKKHLLYSSKVLLDK